MTTADAIKLLDQFRAGKLARDKVLQAFQQAPLADLGFAQVDLHRSLRKNFPEVIYGEGKSPLTEKELDEARRLGERVAQVAATLKRGKNK